MSFDVSALTHPIARPDLAELVNMHVAGETYKYAGLQLMTPRVVDRSEGILYSVTAASIRATATSRRAAGAAVGRVTAAVAEHAFSCNSDANEFQIPEDGYTNFGASQEKAGVNRLATNILNNQEARIAALFASTEFDSVVDVDDEYNNYGYWDATDADIHSALALGIDTVMSQCGMRPNVLVASATLMSKMLANQNLNELTKYTLGSATPEVRQKALSDAFGLKFAFSYAINGSGWIWPDDHVILAVAAQDINGDDPCVGRTVICSPESPTNFNVKTYPEPSTRSVIYQAWQNTDEVLFSLDYAACLKVLA